MKQQGYFGSWGLWVLFHLSIPEDSVNKHNKKKIDNRLYVLGKLIAHENQKKEMLFYVVVFCSMVLCYTKTVKCKIWKDRRMCQ